jgi:hypothetical protein
METDLELELWTLSTKQADILFGSLETPMAGEGFKNIVGLFKVLDSDL